MPVSEFCMLCESEVAVRVLWPEAKRALWKQARATPTWAVTSPEAAEQARSKSRRALSQSPCAR